MRKVVKIAVLALALGGCNQTMKVAYDHPSASESKMMADRYECIQKSQGYAAVAAGGYGQAATMTNGGLMANCMAAKGYMKNAETGRLVVPTALIVRSYGQ